MAPHSWLREGRRHAWPRLAEMLRGSAREASGASAQEPHCVEWPSENAQAEGVWETTKTSKTKHETDFYPKCKRNCRPREINPSF